MKTILGIIAVLIAAGACNAVLGTPQTCDKTVLPHNWPSSHIYMTDVNGNLPYVPLINHTAIIHDDDEWNTSNQPRTANVTLTIQDKYTGRQVFNNTQSLQMQPCGGPESVEWRFVPTQASDYIATISDDRGNVSMSFRSVPDPPLEQVRSGVDSHNVICRQDLQLVIKAEDGSPACVKPDTAQILVERGWAANMPQTNQVTSVKTNPFGVAALVIYNPPSGCLTPPSNTTLPSCPPNNFYLKINSNSTAYLMGYNICDGNSCAKSNDLSILLPINTILNPYYQTIGLPVNLQWKYGDTVNIQLEVSPNADNKTASPIDLGNSIIVH